MNKAFRNVAYHARIDAALEGATQPNRAQIRERVRRSPADTRRAIFGTWRNRGR